jgi:hypothetical protein
MTLARSREGKYRFQLADQPADLVLLDGNPIHDIRNTQKIAAVIIGGRLFNRAALDRMLVTAQSEMAELK